MNETETLLLSFVNSSTITKFSIIMKKNNHNFLGETNIDENLLYVFSFSYCVAFLLEIFLY